MTVSLLTLRTGPGVEAGDPPPGQWRLGQPDVKERRGRSRSEEGISFANGFDPARERAIVALACEALERTRDQRDAIEPDELVATGLSYARRPLAQIGRGHALELAGHALRLGCGGEPSRAQLARTVERRSNARAAGDGPLPAAIRSIPWEIAPLGDGRVGFRSAALHTLEAVTVAWPPKGAARVWHPPRQMTIEQLREIAAHALSGPHHLDPGDLLEMTEREEQREVARIPEELFEDALAAYAALPINGAMFAVEEVVRSCAAINRMLCPAEDRYQIDAIAHEAAEVIDGAGFAGGARADLEHLFGCLLGDLARIPGPLGHSAREPGRHERSVEAARGPAVAMRTGLIALWVQAV